MDLSGHQATSLGPNKNTPFTHFREMKQTQRGKDRQAQHAHEGEKDKTGGRIS